MSFRCTLVSSMWTIRHYPMLLFLLKVVYCFSSCFKLLMIFYFSTDLIELFVFLFDICRQTLPCPQNLLACFFRCIPCHVWWWLSGEHLIVFITNSVILVSSLIWDLAFQVQAVFFVSPFAMAYVEIPPHLGSVVILEQVYLCYY